MLGEAMDAMSSDATREEFAKRVEVSMAAGLVDFKAMVNLNNNTSTRELMWTVANALRCKQDRELKPAFSIEPRA
mgnify:CR=1 FL=1